jgi:transcriptional regulator with AAA-type ATPase domain
VTFDEIPKDFIEHLTNHPVDGNIRGILNQIDRLLVLSPRDKRGRPVLSQWQSIPGLSPRRRSLDMPTYLTAKMPLTYRELMNRPWNLLNADFPGLNEMLEQLKDKLFQEAQTKFKTNRALAQVFKISESTASLLVKRHAKERTMNSAQAGVVR